MVRLESKVRFGSRITIRRVIMNPDVYKGIGINAFRDCALDDEVSISEMDIVVQKLFMYRVGWEEEFYCDAIMKDNVSNSFKKALAYMKAHPKIFGNVIDDTELLKEEFEQGVHMGHESPHDDERGLLYE